MDSPTASSSTAKLQGYDLYRALGSPRHVVAPMVDASELAWRVFSRSPVDPASLGADGQPLTEQVAGEASSDAKGKGRAAFPAAHLAYTPMIHARLFSVSSAASPVSSRPY
jgi:tRNA-dihydrouridine synthase